MPCLGDVSTSTGPGKHSHNRIVVKVNIKFGYKVILVSFLPSFILSQLLQTKRRQVNGVRRRKRSQIRNSEQPNKNLTIFDSNKKTFLCPMSSSFKVHHVDTLGLNISFFFEFIIAFIFVPFSLLSHPCLCLLSCASFSNFYCATIRKHDDRCVMLVSHIGTGPFICIRKGFSFWRSVLQGVQF